METRCTEWVKKLSFGHMYFDFCEASITSEDSTSEDLSAILCKPANLRRNCAFSLQAITETTRKSIVQYTWTITRDAL